MNDYIEIDEFGIREVRCMLCNTTVKARTYIDMPSKTEEGKTVPVIALKEWSNYRTVKVDLADGTYATPIICQDCEKKKGNFLCHGPGCW